MAGKPLPRLEGPNLPFWEGARAQKLMLQRCLDCATWRFPAARVCAACRSERTEWQQASGRGTVHSFCVFHKGYFPGFAGELPYHVVQVRLAEGVDLFSNLVGVTNDQVRIGMLVSACFELEMDQVTLVKFRKVP